jgi:2-polyprenyl-3-methyl-5-hydroxy-6-metoxy-1,4-benzoquinol methylase
MKFYNKKNYDYYDNTRYEIEELLPNSVKNILEVGCGSGSTLKWLKKKYKNINTYGVELNTEAFKEAKKNCDFVLNLDIEKKEFYERQIFDLILILDVLEHLQNPWDFLDKIILKMHKESSLIICLPNVRHYKVLKQLIISAEWRYEKSGILDETHLRFFTHKSFERMLENKKLKIVKSKSYPVDFKSKTRLFNMLTLSLFKDFFSQQYIYFIKKK